MRGQRSGGDRFDAGNIEGRMDAQGAREPEGDCRGVDDSTEMDVTSESWR